MVKWKKLNNNTTVLQIILYINAQKRLLFLLFAEGIYDLQVPKTYDKPLNCVFFGGVLWWLIFRFDMIVFFLF